MSYDAHDAGQPRVQLRQRRSSRASSRQANFPLLRPTSPTRAPMAWPRSRVEPYVAKTGRTRGHQGRDPGHRQPPRAELRAAQQHPGPDLHRPASRRPRSSLRRCAAHERRRRRLTHIGFTENPTSVEVDTNVDTNLADDRAGIDAIIGGHSHTEPRSRPVLRAPPSTCPPFVDGPGTTPGDHQPGLPLQQHLGELCPGLLPKTGGGYEVVSRAGHYISVGIEHVPKTRRSRPSSTRTSPRSTAYNNTVIGQTTVPDRRPAGLHAGDQRRQPAGRRRRSASWTQNGITAGLPSLGRDDQPARSPTGSHAG